MRRRLARRLFLTHVSRASLGLVVMSAAACATDDAADEVADASAAASRSGTDGDAAAASPVGRPTSPNPSETGVDWRQVDLGFVSAYVLVRGASAAVVDTGTSGSEGAIEEALQALDLDWYAVDHVIFTHKHADHIGSATAVLQAAEAAAAYAGEPDVLSVRSPRDVTPVRDGDEVFGLQIVATPGHTAGHVSVLDPVGGLLVAGDALVGAADGGGVAGPDAAYTADMDTAIESVRKLATLRFDTVVFGHGAPVEQNADTQVAALAERL